jgi:hypothetical protein
MRFVLLLPEVGFVKLPIPGYPVIMIPLRVETLAIMSAERDIGLLEIQLLSARQLENGLEQCLAVPVSYHSNILLKGKVIFFLWCL